MYQYRVCAAIYRSQPRPIRHFYHRRARDKNGGWVWVRDSQLNSVHGRFTVVHYFYSKLEPWTHYVPLNRDLSDVVGKVQWARERDEEVSRLGVGSTVEPLYRGHHRDPAGWSV